MNDVLVLRSAISLMESRSHVLWSNKYVCPEGYSYNESGYVITNSPRPYIKVCVGVMFWFLIKRLGLREYLKQNAIALRLLNPDCHQSIVSGALAHSLRKMGLQIIKEEYNSIINEVYALETIPTLDSSFISWRRTWFREDCDYRTISNIVRLENSNKIDSDRELMSIDTKYITSEVAEFTGFSIKRIDNYWKEKLWNKKLRTVFTLKEAIDDLESKGNVDPSRVQLAETSGLSVGTISRTMIDLKKLIAESNKALQTQENKMLDEK